MMINNDYASIVATAKASNATKVNFDQNVAPVQAIKAEQDTVTLSQQAMAMMNGEAVKPAEMAPTYVKPETARSLLAQSAAESDDVEKPETRTSFAEVMQKIVDQRMGIDREKLEEIDAMIEEIASNEDMSPQEKEKAIERLEEMKDEIIEESIEQQKLAGQNDKSEDKVLEV